MPNKKAPKPKYTNKNIQDKEKGSSKLFEGWSKQGKSGFIDGLSCNDFLPLNCFLSLLKYNYLVDLVFWERERPKCQAVEENLKQRIWDERCSTIGVGLVWSLRLPRRSLLGSRCRW